MVIKKIKELKKELKSVKISFYILYVLAIGTLFLEGYLMGYFKSSNVDFDYSDLDCEERKVAEEMINELNPLYLVLASKITFTKNISKYCDIKGCMGRNRFRRVYVQWTSDYDFDKNTLCHELIHSALILRYSSKENMVYDMADKGVCYDS